MKHTSRATIILARNGWKASDAVRLLLVLCACMVATWPAWLEMFSAATRHGDAQPGLMVLPVMAWLIWVRRARLRFLKPGRYEIGWAVLIAGAQFFYMGLYIYELRSAWHLGAVLMFAGGVFVCTGRSVVKQFLPASLIMPMLVPVPQTLAVLISTPIQEFEANAIAALYSLFGVGVDVFTTPAANWMVVGGTTLPLEHVCKGLPTILSLMVVTYGFVFGSPLRPLVRLLLLVLSPLVALLSTAVTLGGTLWLYDSDWALSQQTISTLTGWLTLLLAFLLTVSLLRVLSWASVPVHQYHLASSAG